MQGSEAYIYEWSIKNNSLILSASNSVWVRNKKGETEIQENKGESTFKIQRKGKVLILTRLNNTFTESYTFKVSK